MTTNQDKASSWLVSSFEYWPIQVRIQMLRCVWSKAKGAARAVSVGVQLICFQSPAALAYYIAQMMKGLEPSRRQQ
eukprot:scaffold155203_cov46-Prasinocladus_malaysianus.AAC.2